MSSILLVDDEPEILSMLTLYFELKKGITCDQSESAIEGLKKHETQLYPVILTDIRMPKMDGITFIREVKKVSPTCIVYVMTGYASLSGLVECLELGAADYFTKPFNNIDNIVNDLSSAVERHQRWKKDLSKFAGHIE